MKKDKKIDLLIVILIPLITAMALLYFKANFLVSTLFLFGLPSLYLALRSKNVLKKVAFFSLLCSIPATVAIDYIIVKDRGWYIVSSTFPFRIFDVIVVEQFIWGFLWFFYAIIFYECFLNKKKHRSIFSFFFKKKELITKRMEYFSLLIFTFLAILIFLAIFSPTSLSLNYAYLILGLILSIIPLTLFLFKFPNLLSRFLWFAVYFTFFSMVVEYVGLNLNHWIFPGNHFIGMTNFFGFRIPWEEVIIYFIFFTPSALVYYEFFNDDRR